MRQRLHGNFMVTTPASSFANDFFEGDPFESKVQREAVIESVYNNNTLKATTYKVEVIKLGWTDGVMRFKYLEDTKFYGLQETKRDVKPTNTQLTKQLIQIFGYYNQLDPIKKDLCKVFCINSAYFYSFVFRDDIQDLLDNVLGNLQASGYSASKLYKNCPEEAGMINNWVMWNLDKLHINRFYSMREAKEFKLDEAITEIYLNCLS